MNNFETMLPLTVVIIDSVVYSHKIDSKTDATFFIKEEENVAMFRVDSSANLFDSNDIAIGRFRMNKDGYWIYTSQDFKVEVFTGNKSLLKAEMKIFKDLLALTS